MSGHKELKSQPIQKPLSIMLDVHTPTRLVHWLETSKTDSQYLFETSSFQLLDCEQLTRPEYKEGDKPNLIRLMCGKEKPAGRFLGVTDLPNSAGVMLVTSEQALCYDKKSFSSAPEKKYSTHTFNQPFLSLSIKLPKEYLQAYLSDAVDVKLHVLPDANQFLLIGLNSSLLSVHSLESFEKPPQLFNMEGFTIMDSDFAEPHHLALLLRKSFSPFRKPDIEDEEYQIPDSDDEDESRIDFYKFNRAEDVYAQNEQKRKLDEDKSTAIYVYDLREDNFLKKGKNVLALPMLSSLQILRGGNLWVITQHPISSKFPSPTFTVLENIPGKGLKPISKEIDYSIYPVCENGKVVFTPSSGEANYRYCIKSYDPITKEVKTIYENDTKDESGVPRAVTRLFSTQSGVCFELSGLKTELMLIPETPKLAFLAEVVATKTQLPTGVASIIAQYTGIYQREYSGPSTTPKFQDELDAIDKEIREKWLKTYNEKTLLHKELSKLLNSLNDEKETFTEKVKKCEQLNKLVLPAKKGILHGGTKQDPNQDALAILIERIRNLDKLKKSAPRQSV